MTYQIIITEETSANIIIDNNTTNVSITTNEYPITIQYNAVIEQAGGNAYGNSNVAAYLASSSLAGNIITSANISGAYILGNGSQLTGIVATSTYGNANVAANLAAFGSNPISTTGNITAGYFAGNGSLLTNITAGNITGTVANATYALNANAATYATNAVQAATANVANSVAGANVSGTVANATYALNSNAATFATQATFATTANAVAGANVSGTVANATYALNSNAATFAGTVTTAAQPNITSVGILTAVNTSGNISATGNITGNYFLGNGSQLTGLPATYGNANVAANLAAFANNPISTSGNITSGNLNVTIDAVITGNLTVNGTTTTVNSNTVTINDKFINVANNASTAAQANGGGLGVGPVGTEYATLTYNSAGNIWTTNIGLSVTGNVTGSVFTGNGSGLTALTGANVTGTVANATYALNANASTYAGTVTTNAQPNITSVGILTAVNTSGNISATGNITAGYFFGNGSQLTGVTATDAIRATTLRFPVKNTSGGTLAQNTPVYATGSVGATETLEVSASRADTAATMPCIGLLETALGVNAFGYAVAIGALSSTDTSTYTIGQTLYVAPTGGLTQSRPTNANAVQSVGAAGRINGSTGQIEVNIWNQEGLPNLGSGNVWIGNAAAYPTQTVLATYSGNIGAGYFSGNGSLLSALTGANVSGTVANATYALNSNAATYASVATFANTANAVAGANVSGTVANAAYATSAGSATTATSALTANTVTDAAQANITSVGILTSLSVSGNVDAGNLRTAGLVTATGNVTGGNLITAGTVSATAATANVLLSNIRITSQAVNAGQQYTAVNARDVSVSPDTGRMLFGNGFQGNVSTGVDFGSRQAKARFAFWDTVQVPNNYAAAAVNMASTAQFQLTGNTNSQARLFNATNFAMVASEGTANTFTSVGTVPAAFTAFNTFAIAGNWVGNTAGGMANVGNVIVNTGSGGVFGISVNGGSTMGNAFGVVSTNQSTAAAGTTATVNNQIYFSPWDSIAAAGTVATPGNVFAYYNPGTTNSYGVTRASQMRSSANYYFLRNDDPVAQTQLGTLRSYNEFQYTANTSGTVNIDKSNAQVHFIAPTANVTIGSYLNFVTTLNDGTNNDNETDTVTLIIQQGATPYTVTMPTGNASIKYAGGISTIGATANSVTMVSISAIRSAANATLYLTTVSSEFT